MRRICSRISRFAISPDVPSIFSVMIIAIKWRDLKGTHEEFVQKRGKSFAEKSYLISSVSCCRHVWRMTPICDVSPHTGSFPTFDQSSDSAYRSTRAKNFRLDILSKDIFGISDCFSETRDSTAGKRLLIPRLFTYFTITDPLNSILKFILPFRKLAILLQLSARRGTILPLRTRTFH